MTLAKKPRLAKGTSQRPRYLALCPRNTESLVAAELLALPGVSDVELWSSAVSFSGDLAALYRANLNLRCASRVLRVLGDSRCDHPDDLYEAVRALPWEEFLSPKGTLAVNANGETKALTNTMFTAQKTKDAVVDRFRDRLGRRPSVETQRPNLRINVQLYQKQGEPRVLVAADSSDPPLHQRGYREQAGPAPLKENLAAALYALTVDSGNCSTHGKEAVHTTVLHPTSPTRKHLAPIVDLFCGSGTLLAEAGLSALGVAPGLHREFGFMRWRDFDARLWQAIKAEAKANVSLADGVFLFGSDVNSAAIKGATRNLNRAGLPGFFQLGTCDFRDARPPPSEPGIVLCNPPYGERLGQNTELAELYRALGDTLKRRFVGYRAYVFTANLAMAKQIGLRASERHPLFNGMLESRLLRFDLY
ncbi:MAG TPA: THUMP domain-containing protein [Pseudomonadota bacterium]|nr:THUMP domain-containing protein [Pseudomonadota bacterium]